jgi:hypothetical protein
MIGTTVCLCITCLIKKQCDLTEEKQRQKYIILSREEYNGLLASNTNTNTNTNMENTYPQRPMPPAYTPIIVTQPQTQAQAPLNNI